MVKKSPYVVWGILLALCALLGFIPEPAPAAANVLTALAVVSFIPPAVVIYLSWKARSDFDLKLIRSISLGSLVLTLALLVANFLALGATEWVGDLLYGLLVVISTPMVCGQIWVVSLVLWAALLWTCVILLGKLKRAPGK